MGSALNAAALIGIWIYAELSSDPYASLTIVIWPAVALVVLLPAMLFERFRPIARRRPEIVRGYMASFALVLLIFGGCWVAVVP